MASRLSTATNTPRACPSSTVAHRLRYLVRIADVYLHRSCGPLSFWYETPQLNERAFNGGLDYFMTFQGKANYAGPFDDTGIPLLDYRGDIGLQYNPIAIAQYGLARFNRWSTRGTAGDREAWHSVAKWLAREGRPNRHGIWVWMHDFDWPYRQPLVAPWYSGLAQGVGLSMLVRAAHSAKDTRFANAAHEAFEPFLLDVSAGGVMVTNTTGTWIEEYLVTPPSRILNGFIWALWGIYDYLKWSRRQEALAVWKACVRTLERNLGAFDTGWWSLYEMPVGNLRMLASHYYHQLHIEQLKVMYRLTGIRAFVEHAEIWHSYLQNPWNRSRALASKALFKLCHY